MSSKRSPILTRKKPSVQYTVAPVDDVENADPNSSPSPPSSSVGNVPASKKKAPASKRKAQPKEKAPPKKRKTKLETVNEKVQKMGVDPDNTSKCVRAAIYKGFIKVTGTPADLQMIVHSEEGECGHTINATLGDLLDQPDYAGCDYEDGLQDATVLCTEDGCAEEGGGRTYVTNLCKGRPSFDSGKFHNHCGECKVFGVCINDYREAHCDNCGKHYFAGNSGFPCRCQGDGSDGYDSFW